MAVTDVRCSRMPQTEDEVRPARSVIGLRAPVRKLKLCRSAVLELFPAKPWRLLWRTSHQPVVSLVGVFVTIRSRKLTACSNRASSRQPGQRQEASQPVPVHQSIERVENNPPVRAGSTHPLEQRRQQPLHLNAAQHQVAATGHRLYSARGGSSEPSALPLTRLATPVSQVSRGRITYSDHASQALDDGEQSGSYGTLMLSQGGRSKYLGPTAGSEWLKDVRSQASLLLIQLNQCRHKHELRQSRPLLLGPCP